MSETTTRQLVTRAAKAAGLKIEWQGWTCYLVEPNIPPVMYKRWNPLYDDGDALRLAVDLKMRVQVWESTGEATAHWGDLSESEPLGSNPYDATRRVIVRIAARMPPRPS